jgi:GNAT superfamily N-acetyltransferase
VHIAALAPVHLDDARALLVTALPHDRIDVVAAEKLFGDNGTRQGAAFGAFEGDTLTGVVAVAGRWVKLLAVETRHRRKGIGSALLAHVEPYAAGRSLRVADHPGNYLSPGLDGRYHDGRAFFAARGFVERGVVENIRAPLDKPLRQTDVTGYELRRVNETDRAQLLDWIARVFAPVWAFEVARAAAGPRQAVHAAWLDGAPVAFAAADGNNQGLGWFGPAGTEPAHRGKRLGEALLVRCLEDVRGLPEAGVIAWIGPKAFYAKTVGAVDDRRFVSLEQW